MALYNPNKIYLYKGNNKYYKLHKIEGSIDNEMPKYAFVCLENNTSCANGHFTEDKIDYYIDDDKVFQFDNIYQMCDYILNHQFQPKF